MDDKQRRVKLSALYSDLAKFCKISEYADAIRKCNQILHMDPKDSFAFGVKIDIHIQLGNFGEALEFISKNPKFLNQELSYKKAYCLYRINQTKEAEEVLIKVKHTAQSKEMLLTQIYYRMDRFTDAYSEFMSIYSNFNKDDLKVPSDCNMMAILACLRSNGMFSSRLKNVDLEYTYELKYNKACTLIAMGKLSEALGYLESSEKEAAETLGEDEYSIEEINEEKRIIMAQRAFVYQKLGRESEALHIYYKIISEKPKDEALVAVISNNLLCISKDKNVFLGRKRIKAMTLGSVHFKLNSSQRSRFALNQCLFFYHTQQTERCKEACKNLLEKFPKSEPQIVKIKSGLALRAEGFEAGKSVIDEFVAQEPHSKTKMYLALVQQLLRMNEKEKAIMILKSLGSDSFRLGVVSALVTLYQFLGKPNEACEVLAEAVEYYKKDPSQERIVKLLYRQSAQLMMINGNPEAAAKTLEELREFSPNDHSTLAQLVIAYAKFDLLKAETLSLLLKPVMKPANLDLEALESPNWFASIKLSKKISKDLAPSTPLEVPSLQPACHEKRKKRKKKNKLPANYDPLKSPNPERWLPLSERCGFKPKKTKKGKVGVGKGTQGATS